MMAAVEAVVEVVIHGEAVAAAEITRRNRNIQQ